MAVEDTTDNSRRRHEMLANLAESSAQFVHTELGMPEDDAIDLGNAVADFVAKHYAGQHIYFVKDMRTHLSERDRQICAEMERGKAVDVASKHGLSYVRIHQIYRRYREELALRAREAQGDMFARQSGAGVVGNLDADD